MHRAGDQPPSEVEDDAMTDQREIALKYYELHITHRAQLFNFMLIVVAAATIAYTRAFAAGDYLLAGVVAVLAGVLILTFLGANTVTVKKIEGSKHLIAQGQKEVEIMLTAKNCSVCGLRDRQWKAAIHWFLAIAFFAGAGAAFLSVA